MNFIVKNPEVEEKIIQNAKFISDLLWPVIQFTEKITEKHYEDHEGKWPINDQYFKIVEEAVEAQKAFKKDLQDKNEEHLDIFFSWLTLTHMRKPTKEEFTKAIFNDLLKFHSRGWLY